MVRHRYPPPRECRATRPDHGLSIRYWSSQGNCRLCLVPQQLQRQGRAVVALGRVQHDEDPQFCGRRLRRRGAGCEPIRCVRKRHRRLATAVAHGTSGGSTRAFEDRAPPRQVLFLPHARQQSNGWKVSTGMGRLSVATGTIERRTTMRWKSTAAPLLAWFLAALPAVITSAQTIPPWATTDASAWANEAQATWITDMSRCSPSTALASTIRRGHWKLIPYEMRGGRKGVLAWTSATA